MFAKILQILPYIVTAISITIAIIKELKAGKKEKVIKLASVVKSIPKLIVEAEELLGQGNGSAKKTYVLNQLCIMCLQLGIEYDENGLGIEIENVLATPQKKEI